MTTSDDKTNPDELISVLLTREEWSSALMHCHISPATLAHVAVTEALAPPPRFACEEDTDHEAWSVTDRGEYLATTMNWETATMIADTLNEADRRQP